MMGPEQILRARLLAEKIIPVIVSERPEIVLAALQGLVVSQIEPYTDDLETSLNKWYETLLKYARDTKEKSHDNTN